MIVIGIDPSINTTGVCILTTSIETPKNVVVVSTIKSTKGNSDRQKAHEIIGKLSELLGARRAPIGAIEWPAEKSFNKNSNISKLWYIVGRLDEWLENNCLWAISIPLSRESKIETIEYVNEKYGLALRVKERSPDSHMADAVRIAEKGLEWFRDPKRTLSERMDG